MELLPNINNHDDLLRLTDEEKIALCGEIRQFLIEHVSQTGGHLAGNLGIVELAVAIETVYNTEKDRLVFDVGHQSYVHKILTGRRDSFDTLRQFGGISGFPKPSESNTDSFVAGHASSSVSIALGMARARTLLNGDYQVAALIGDGASTGGMAYEGLNNAADSHEPMVIILNDNEMSIDKNVGGMSKHLSRLRSSENYLDTKRWYRRTIRRVPGGEAFYQFTSRVKNRVKRFLLPTTLFENMGLTYLGPVDGHDLVGLISVLSVAKELNEPVLVHVVTKKGFGYRPAEDNPAKFHGIGKFDPETGMTLAQKVTTFSDSFGETMLELGQSDSKICAVTAAMPAGTGLIPFSKRFPNRLFDVGIAEEHAVSMAGGLAKQGMTPVVAIYSTFMQRAYDQIFQDVAMLRLHVILAIDRAGLVGDDGPTHHGVFDVGFLRQIPGMLLLAPASLAEQKAMLRWAAESYNGPTAIRYPRGGEGAYQDSGWDESKEFSEQNQLVCHRQGKDAVMVTYGVLVNQVMEAANLLEMEDISVKVLRVLNLSQLPMEAIRAAAEKDVPIIVAEEVCSGSGIREAIAYGLQDYQVKGIDLGGDFVEHGSQQQLYRRCGLCADQIAAAVKEACAR